MIIFPIKIRSLNLFYDIYFKILNILSIELCADLTYKNNIYIHDIFMYKSNKNKILNINYIDKCVINLMINF